MTDAPRYDIRPVTPDLWDELAGFFGVSGAYSNCWCVWWRVTSKEFSAGCADGGAGNRALLERLTKDGEVPGLLAYADEGPVGWVSVAPRPQFERVGRSRILKPDAGEDFADESVWSVSCFWIPRGYRRKGIGRALLDGAVAYAFEQGAAVVEGYPVDTQGTKTQASSIYTGTQSMFERAGFTEALRRGEKRPVMRRTR
jgi:GNAT superfamily N-acetyltransferase